jgi:hypothetical protein
MQRNKTVRKLPRHEDRTADAPAMSGSGCILNCLMRRMRSQKCEGKCVSKFMAEPSACFKCVLRELVERTRCIVKRKAVSI